MCNEKETYIGKPTGDNTKEFKIQMNNEQSHKKLTINITNQISINLLSSVS